MPFLFKAPSLTTLKALAKGFGLMLAWRLTFAFAAWHFSGLRPNLASFESHESALAAWSAADPLHAFAAYLGVYTLVCALCLDGTATLVVFSGALFGFFPGLLLSTLGSSLGGLATFLFSRRYLTNWFRVAFPRLTLLVERGLERDGDTWLLTARMVPMVSFPMTNLALGLSSLRPSRFLLLSTLGLLPCNAAYVWAGTHLAGVRSFRDLLAPGLWVGLAVLGLLPLAIRWATRSLCGGLKRTL